MTKRTKKAKTASTPPEQPATMQLPTRITEERRRELAVRIVDLADEQSQLHTTIARARADLREVQGELERLSAIRVSGVEVVDVPVEHALMDSVMVTMRMDHSSLWPDGAHPVVARRPATAEELQAARQAQLPFAAPEGGQGSVEGPGEVAQEESGTMGRVCKAMAPLEPWLGCTLPMGHPGPDHVAMAAPTDGPRYEAASWPVEEEADVDAELRRMGMDPAEIAARGAKFVEAAMGAMDAVVRDIGAAAGRVATAFGASKAKEASRGEKQGDLPGDEPSSLDAPITRVASAAIFDKGPNGKVWILLGRRAPTSSHGGRWCTLGGKVEQGESDTEALFRELREEAGEDRFTVGPVLYEHSGERTTGAGRFHLACYACEPKADFCAIEQPEHGIDAVEWFGAEQLEAVDLAPADDAHRAELIAEMKRREGKGVKPTESEPPSLDAPSGGLYFCKDSSCPRYREPTDAIRCGYCGRTTEIREPTPDELKAIEAAPEEPVPADPRAELEEPQACSPMSDLGRGGSSKAERKAELDRLIEEHTRGAAKGKKRRAKGEKASRKGGGL